MIPKIIHYCWFGRNKLPKSVSNNIKNWKEKCPDYTIKEWNEDNFDINQIPFVKEAYKLGKYAFVSDVARLNALYSEGGIYLDVDVILRKSFDDYLVCKSFIGKECPFVLSTAVIGATQHLNWLNSFIDSYKNKHFILNSGKLSEIPNTRLITDFFDNSYPLYFDDIKIFDIDFFCAKSYAKDLYYITENTVAIHEYTGTWTERNKTLLGSMVNRITNVFIRTLITIRRN